MKKNKVEWYMMSKVSVRIISFLLVLAAFCFCVFSVYATEEFPLFYETTEHGLTTMNAFYSSASPVLDGKISSGEYGEGNVSSLGEGIHLTNFGTYGGCYDFCCEESSFYSPFLIGARQETYLCYDTDKLYLGIRLELEDMADFSPVSHKIAGRNYSVSVSLSLDPGKDPISGTSFLTNQYFFSPTDLSCVGVIGNRVRQSQTQPSKMLMQISSFSSEETGRNKGYEDENGVVWNGDTYAANACLSLSALEGKGEAVFEAVIPLGDLFQILSEEDLPFVKIALLAQDSSKEFYGSFLSQFLLNKSVQGPAGTTFLCIGSGLACGMPFPSNPDLTWQKWIVSEYPSSGGGNSYMEAIPSPVRFNFLRENPIDPPQTEDPVLPEMPPLTEDVIQPEEPPQTQNQKPETSFPDIFSTSEENEDGLTDMEDVLSGLPPSDFEFPENSQVLPDDSKKEEKTSLWGTVLGLVTGLSLVIASVFLFIFFASDRKKREDDESTSKNEIKAKKSKKK